MDSLKFCGRCRANWYATELNAKGLCPGCASRKRKRGKGKGTARASGTPVELAKMLFSR